MERRFYKKWCLSCTKTKWLIQSKIKGEVSSKIDQVKTDVTQDIDTVKTKVEATVSKIANKGKGTGNKKEEDPSNVLSI